MTPMRTDSRVSDVGQLRTNGQGARSVEELPRQCPGMAGGSLFTTLKARSRGIDHRAAGRRLSNNSRRPSTTEAMRCLTRGCSDPNASDHWP